MVHFTPEEIEVLLTAAAQLQLTLATAPAHTNKAREYLKQTATTLQQAEQKLRRRVPVLHENPVPVRVCNADGCPYAAPYTEIDDIDCHNCPRL